MKILKWKANGKVPPFPFGFQNFTLRNKIGIENGIGTRDLVHWFHEMELNMEMEMDLDD